MLRDSWAKTSSPVPRFRLIRVEGRRAVVEVGHGDAASARAAWNCVVIAPQGSLTTYRTWGTLVGAKRWLRSGVAAPAPGSARSG